MYDASSCQNPFESQNLCSSQNQHTHYLCNVNLFNEIDKKNVFVYAWNSVSFLPLLVLLQLENMFMTVCRHTFNSIMNDDKNRWFLYVLLHVIVYCVLYQVQLRSDWRCVDQTNAIEMFCYKIHLIRINWSILAEHIRWECIYLPIHFVRESQRCWSMFRLSIFQKHSNILFYLIKFLKKKNLKNLGWWRR